MKASILITTYNRPRQLRACLKSILHQDLAGLDYEILVLNDGNQDESQDICEEFRVRYLHTGCRNAGAWRTMGYAANIGIKQTKGEIVILSNSDMYHLGDTVRSVIGASERDPMALSTLRQVYDDDGSLIKHLIEQPLETAQRDEIIERIRTMQRPGGMYPTNPDMPFFLAVRRGHLERIGGYDEDFIGVASEDCDLLDRLLKLGCHYLYAREGEAIHLYHARRSIEELRQDPGFAYNISLREQRRDQIVRNRGHNWGELLNADAAELGAPPHLVLWVTSRCNLACPKCNQRETRRAAPDYAMDQAELGHIVWSCRRRGFHFSTIELTGGEPTSWSLFESALQQLAKAKLADRITFITNGNDAERTAKLANRYGIQYTLSATQATPEQLQAHRKYGVGLLLNEEKHRSGPSHPLPDALPAICSQSRDRHGRVVRQLLYVRKRVYYCCMAFANARILGHDLERYSCLFEEDFTKHFAERKFDQPICSVCLCNKRVWDQV